MGKSKRTSTIIIWTFWRKKTACVLPTIAELGREKKPHTTELKVFKPTYGCKYGRELMFYIVKLLLFLQFSLFTGLLCVPELFFFSRLFLRTDSSLFFARQSSVCAFFFCSLCLSSDNVFLRVQGGRIFDVAAFGDNKWLVSRLCERTGSQMSQRTKE